jgi:hypothetical protein
MLYNFAYEYVHTILLYTVRITSHIFWHIVETIFFEGTLGLHFLLYSVN